MVKRKSHKRKSHKRRSHKRRNMSIRSKKGGGIFDDASGYLARSAARTASSVATGASKFAVGIAANQGQKNGLISKDQANLGKDVFGASVNALNSGFKKVMTKDGIQNIKGAVSNPEEAFRKFGASANAGLTNLYNKYQNPDEIAKLKQRGSDALAGAQKYVNNNPQLADFQSRAYSSLSSGFNNLKQSAASFQNPPVRQMGAGKQTKRRRRD